MPDFDLMTYLNLHGGPTRTVFGAWNTALSRGDFLYLDYLLYENNKLSNIIELGTMHGLSTLYMGVTAALRGGWVWSYDIVDLVPLHIREAAKGLPIEYRIGDVLDDQTVINTVRSNMNNGITLLFCDNGHKEKEVELYARYVGVGSVLLVHDCWTEVHQDTIEPFLAGYEAFSHDVAEKMSAHLRAWRRIV